MKRRLAFVMAVFLLASPALGASLIDPRTGGSVDVQPGEDTLHVVFFATWCPTCMDELPRLAELEARWGRQGYRLVLVAIRTRQTSDRLREFIDEERPPGRLLFDAEGEAESAWGAKRLPTHVVFDAKGRELARSAALNDTIEDAIAGQLADSRGARE